MTLSDQFLTLVAFPFCFVIQLVTIDKVVSNYPIVRRVWVTRHAGFAIQRKRAADLQSATSTDVICYGCHAGRCGLQIHKLNYEVITVGAYRIRPNAPAYPRGCFQGVCNTPLVKSSRAQEP